MEAAEDLNLTPVYCRVSEEFHFCRRKGFEWKTTGALAMFNKSLGIIF